MAPDAPQLESPPESVEDRIRSVGDELARTIGAVLDELPGGVHRPAGLARALGLNRAVASKVLSATAAKDPLEVVHVIPGPEPLRALVRSASAQDVADASVRAAQAAIDRFDRLIRDEAGTRSALDALISASLPGARERFELASKYNVFKGLSQLKGARADAWLGTAIVRPSTSDSTRLDLTWLNAALGMQRLRPGVTVRFSYRFRSDQADAGDQAPPDFRTLDGFGEHPSAALEAHASGNMIHYVLPPDLIGPRQATDLFVVDDHPATMRRYAKDEPRNRSSLFVEPAVPVGMLVFDVLLHDEAFPGAEPRLVVYDTGYDGIANVNDPHRDIDRIALKESIEYLGQDHRTFDAVEVPRYAEILDHLADERGWDPARFRGYRTRIQYPVYGWQVCMSFEPPPPPPAPPLPPTR